MTANNSKSVLVVEDEQSLANLLCQILTFSGFKTTLAVNGEEALKQVKVRIPDAIVLDIVMPKLDGWGVCERLKSDPSTRDIPIVVYTTLSERKDLQKGKDFGVSCYITKEKDATDVVQALKKLLGT